MPRKTRSPAYITFNVFFSVALILFLLVVSQFTRCFSAAERIPSVVEYPIVRFLIYGMSISDSGDTVSAQVTILDTAGNECVTVERSWNGSSLSIDFVSAEFSDKKFLFPYLIYGKETVTTRASITRKAGTQLPSYYLENGKCILFGSNTTLIDRRDLYSLARFALNPIASFTRTFSHRYSVDLSQCQPGIYYTIVTGTDGSLRIVAE